MTAQKMVGLQNYMLVHTFANNYVHTLGVSPYLVSRWREVYRFWGIWEAENFRRLEPKLKSSWLCPVGCLSLDILWTLLQLSGEAYKRHKKSTNVLKPSEIRKKMSQEETSKYSLDKVWGSFAPQLWWELISSVGNVASVQRKPWRQYCRCSNEGVHVLEIQNIRDKAGSADD